MKKSLIKITYNKKKFFYSVNIHNKILFFLYLHVNIKKRNLSKPIYFYFIVLKIMRRFGLSRKLISKI